MAEPVHITWVPESEVSQETEERSVLQRWVEHSDGRLELLELPLTPELYLNPELEDKMVQGEWHDVTCHEISGLLRHHFRPRPDVRVFHDLLHLFGKGLSTPSPDVSVVFGIRDRERRDSFDIEKEGLRPSLIIEVVSPMSARVRRTDLTDKVTLYQRVGIREYLIADTTRQSKRYQLLGYRLSPLGRYQPIEPDAEGRLLSETAGVWFQVTPAGDQIFLFDTATGQRLLNLDEQEELTREAKAEAAREAEARKAAEESASREADARREAETEIARLRSEIERLRGER
jgi:Uma2 family endonuclease